MLVGAEFSESASTPGPLLAECWMWNRFVTAVAPVCMLDRPSYFARLSDFSKSPF